MSITILKANKKEILKSLLFVAIIAMGVLFIVNNSNILKISFYLVGCAIIIASLVALIPMMKNYKRLRYTNFRQSFYLYIILLAMSLISGITIILNANRGAEFYYSALASIFFFRSVHRFFYCYIAKKTRQTKIVVLQAVFASLGLAIAAFLTFYTGSDTVASIVVGIALILEGMLGLYNIWWSRLIAGTRIRNFEENKRQNSFNPRGSNDEIIITDYEIIDDTDND